MQIYIGTSGWLYKDWAKRFYPENVKDIDKLAYFAKHFPTVEINSPFYRLPSETSVQRWYKVTPPNFTFAVKLNRYLTHIKRLLPDDEFDETLHEYFVRVHHLKDKLGVVLVQLPPSLQPEVSRIEHLAIKIQQFEKEFKQRFPLAIELRNSHTPELFVAFRAHNIANVVIDSPNRWPASQEITSDLVYIRFHGSRRLYRSSYTDKELKQWAKFIIEKCANCKQVFAYFNNDHAAVAIDNVRTLAELLTDQTNK